MVGIIWQAQEYKAPEVVARMKVDPWTEDEQMPQLCIECDIMTWKPQKVEYSRNSIYDE